MSRLPTRFTGIMIAFAPLFVHRSWKHAQVRRFSALLALGRNAAASPLWIAGHRCHVRPTSRLQGTKY